MFNTPRALGGFPILALHPKSLRQIGEAGVWGKRTPEVYMNLSYGRFVLCWGRGGDRSIGKANLRKGFAPSMEAALPPPPCGDWQANAPTPKTSDSKFDSLRGKMLPHFILPESLVL